MAEGVYIVVEYLTRDVQEEGMPTLGDLTCIRMDGIITDLEAAENIAASWAAETRHADCEVAVFEMVNAFALTTDHLDKPVVQSSGPDPEDTDAIVYRLRPQRFDA